MVMPLITRQHFNVDDSVFSRIERMPVRLHKQWMELLHDNCIVGNGSQAIKAMAYLSFPCTATTASRKVDNTIATVSKRVEHMLQ